MGRFTDIPGMSGTGEAATFDEKQLYRERLLDLEDRIRPYRARAFGVLAVSLLIGGIWIGWWWLLSLAFVAVAFVVADRRKKNSERPEVWVAATWALTPLAIALSVALTGGSESPGKSWFVLPLVTLGARFGRRGIALGVTYTLALLYASTVPSDPGGFLSNPTDIGGIMSMCLAATLLGRAIVISDQDHRREAIIDPLTGLLNRAALAQRFTEERRTPAADGTQRVALIVGDLDHFKLINDEHGHATGDAVLKDVAYLMRKHLRALDQVYRIGGEEFVAVLPGSDLANAEEAAERLRAAVAEARPAGIGVSISFGVMAGEGDECRDFDGLFRLADYALYEAKRGGRNAVRTASGAVMAPTPASQITPVPVPA